MHKCVSQTLKSFEWEYMPRQQSWGRQNTFCLFLSLGGSATVSRKEKKRMTSLKPRRSAVLWGLHRSGGTSASPPPGSRQLGGVQCQEYTLQNKYCLEKMLSCCPFGCVFRKKINGDSKGKVQIWGQGGECTGFSSRDRN